MELTHIATREGRLSSFLREEMGLSAGIINRRKWEGLIFVNGLPQHTDYAVKPGDVISFPLDDGIPDYPAEDGPLDILYEDSCLLALEKEAGILIHPSRSRNTGTLANFVLGYYGRTGQKCAFHPITRLDRDTFGVVLLAKNSHIHARMNALHESGLLEKFYRARVYGAWEGDSGILDAPIARRPLPSLLRYVSPEGKPSCTGWRVLERQPENSLLELQAITGRTHQLRVHCAYAGHPILGDPQYASPESAAYSHSLGLQSQLLCAKRITFPHPETGQSITICSHLDESM